MSRRAYFNLCLQQPAAWLARSIAEPSSGMSACHVLLQRLALRKKVGEVA